MHKMKHCIGWSLRVSEEFWKVSCGVVGMDITCSSTEGWRPRDESLLIINQDQVTHSTILFQRCPFYLAISVMMFVRCKAKHSLKRGLLTLLSQQT
jgi:hypothetical protein